MDRYFQTKYFLEYVIPFTLIGVYILISCVQAYKEYKIDEFMKGQGYNLNRLHKNKIKEVKLKYRKDGDSNAWIKQNI